MAGHGGGLWIAIAWAEGFLLAGLAAVGLAIASSSQTCFDFVGGCPPGESSLGGESVVWLALSGVCVVIGVVIAALASGWPGSRGALQGAVAVVAGAVAAGLGGALFSLLFDEYLPALVLAIGVAGTVSIRPSAPRAVTARLVTLAILVLLAVVFGNVAALVILLALLTLPAIGAVESAVG